MKPVKPRKPTEFKRDPPDLPSHFEDVDPPTDFFSDSEVLIAEKKIQDLEQPNRKVSDFQMEGSVLERVRLAGGRFAAAVWKDVRLVGCDLSNVHVNRMALTRVEFIDCRLTGFRSGALDWRDVLIQNGECQYSQLQRGQFRSCEFDGTNWQDADYQEADLTGSIFRSCNLGRTDFRGARLKGTDLRKSDVEGMLVGLGDLAGAIVDPSQAMVFARLLGLEIR